MTRKVTAILTDPTGHSGVMSVAFGPRDTIATWANGNCSLWDITYHQG